MDQVPAPIPPEASPEVAVPAKPRRKKGPFRTGFLIVLLVAVVIVVGSIELFSGDLVRVALTSGAVASTGARVEVKGASASLLGGSLELRDLAVAPYADTKDSVLKAKTADAEVELGKLLTGLVHIPALTLSEGQISLVRDKNGRLNLDPGPPPGEPEATPEQTKDRDLVQEVGDIIERYKKYHEYYEKVHSTKSKESEQKKEKEERKTYPGMASYLPPIEQLQPTFWLKKMGAMNLSLTSLDERTGKPFLPEFESLSFMMENLSSNEGLTGQPFKLAVAAKPKDAGQWSIQFASPPGKGLARQLMFSLDDVKVADVAKLVSKSLPFDFEDGTFSLRSITPPPAQGDGTTKVKAEPGVVALDLDNVLGAIQLDLSKIKLKAAPGKDKILGVPAPTFLQAFNYAADQVPLSLQFGVSGSTSKPKLELLNSGELLTTLRDQVANSASAQLKALGDSLKAGLESELARHKDTLLDQGKALLEGKADPKDVKKSLQESLKDPQLKSTIDDAKSQLDGLFGKKKKDKKKDEPKKDGG